jgi:DNA-binding response OmpR family regulator
MAKKILVVEDERPLARALELKLTHEGFEVTVTHDGESAIELINTAQFDMILLDLMMPKVDGFSVLKSVQGSNKTPIIVISNLSMEADKTKVVELGASDLLVKSNTPLAGIIQRIHDFLE